MVSVHQHHVIAAKDKLRPIRRFAGLIYLVLAIFAHSSSSTQPCVCDSLGDCQCVTACDQAGCDACPGCNGQRDCSDVCVCQSWAGELRECFADSGITFSNNLTQFYFGTVSGGTEQTARYAGHGDYVANFDLGKLGVHEGLFLKVRAEHRFGSAINEATGALLPANLAADLPVIDSRDLFITNFVLTQALSENLVVFAGKVDSLDGDMNAFAHGRGIKQFSNVAFVANPIALRTIPYASLGAGFAYLMEGEPLFSFLVINPTDTTTGSGFGELFQDGVAFSTELRVPTRFFGRPGHQLIGATYSTREFASLDQDPRIILPQVPIDRASGSWSVYWNTDHYLHVDKCNPKRGWGYFSRGGVADDDTNPLSYFWSLGLGGDSPFRAGRGDAFGIGYYLSDTSDEIAPFLAAGLGGVGDGHGVEAFYNIQATPSLTITPDFQYISQARKSIDDAYVLGVRANLVF